ncbi:hypothetical protein Y958_29185 [Nitrospirillum viridazoti CBAmc]|uniref:Uncharacterized protein n=1 Tax=Nitrospirillum viridazoti CBAmc TaxID=1441467 RepID=A0A248K2M9_9PROT|nr:hypothetical protein Y958_29185 [Nitrospirillum amazonense CBAmc]
MADGGGEGIGEQGRIVGPQGFTTGDHQPYWKPTAKAAGLHDASQCGRRPDHNTRPGFLKRPGAPLGPQRQRNMGRPPASLVIELAVVAQQDSGPAAQQQRWRQHTSQETAQPSRAVAFAGDEDARLTCCASGQTEAKTAMAGIATLRFQLRQGAGLMQAKCKSVVTSKIGAIVFLTDHRPGDKFRQPPFGTRQ